jgi:hypothetical protein
MKPVIAPIFKPQNTKPRNVKCKIAPVMQPAVCHFYILHLVFCILRFILRGSIAPSRSGGGSVKESPQLHAPEAKPRVWRLRAAQWSGLVTPSGRAKKLLPRITRMLTDWPGGQSMSRAGQGVREAGHRNGHHRWAPPFKALLYAHILIIRKPEVQGPGRSFEHPRLKGPLVEPLHRIPYTAAQSLSNIRLVALEGGNE